MGTKEVVQTTFETTTGVELPVVSVKDIAKIMKSSKYIPTQSLSKMDIEKINKYSEQMKKGKWDWSKSKIIVDENNAIMDGHHRVIAAEKARKKIPDSSKTIYNKKTERPSYDWSGELKD